MLHRQSIEVVDAGVGLMPTGHCSNQLINIHCAVHTFGRRSACLEESIASHRIETVCLVAQATI